MFICLKLDYTYDFILGHFMKDTSAIGVVSGWHGTYGSMELIESSTHSSGI
jgi:hypothetical protein